MPLTDFAAGKRRSRSTPPPIGRRTLLYAAGGLLFGAFLTAAGYVIDYYVLYGGPPESWTLGVLRGLHDVTPVHYFADLFGPILALAGGIVGWFQDHLHFYSSHLEELVEVRTRDLLKNEDQLRYLALNDPVTDLPNRTLLLDRMERILLRQQRRSTSVAALHVGVDRFKKINETLGWRIGDRLLTETGRRLKAAVADFEHAIPMRIPGREPTGSVFRVDGDEFVVVLEDARTLRDATRLADVILQAHAGPLRVDDDEVLVSLSVGISIGPRKYDSAEHMLRDARTAMHRAKVQGRARYEVFDHEMLETVEEAIHLETELFQALETRQLRLSYQPLVRLDSGEVVGFEALARWEHADRGAISPGRFITLAEETGLIVPLSRWLFEETFECLKQWQDRFKDNPDLSISVNLSPKYLFHADLESDFATLLRSTGIDPGRVTLEITESSFIDRPGAVAELLCRLKKWGFRIALDDFGTGYSSLSILHELPFDVLKIDQAFTSKIVSDPDVRTIVGSIVGLARKLGLDVVAEGIETAEQLDALRAMRCRYGQGSLLGSPMTVDTAQELLSRGDRRAGLAT